MKRFALALLCGTLLVVAGCTSAESDPTLARQSPQPSPSPIATGPAEPAPSSETSTVRVIDSYVLLTHCGIREAKIGEAFYVAAPPLDDRNGNPPDGWGNPTQKGTMTVLGNGTARFSEGSLVARFILREGATDFLGPLCS